MYYNVISTFGTKNSIIFVLKNKLFTHLHIQINTKKKKNKLYPELKRVSRRLSGNIVSVKIISQCHSVKSMCWNGLGIQTKQNTQQISYRLWTHRLEYQNEKETKFHDLILRSSHSYTHSDERINMQNE